MKRLPRSLFLAASAIIRLVPNSPRRFRTAIAYRFAAIGARGRAFISIAEGIRVDADLGDWLQRLYALGETDLPYRRALVRHIPEGGTFIDVGANVGLYALSIARHVGPEGNCYAFEPFPGNHEALLRNIELNGLSNVHVQRVALSSESGWVTLYGPPGPRADTSGAVGSKATRDYVEVARVPCRPLDSIDVGSRVDAIKVDVEGNELEVLRGAQRLLVRHRPTLLIEVNNPSVYRGVVAFAREFGYVLLEIGSGGRPRGHSTDAPLRVNDLLLIPAERHSEAVAS
jgi:FkbM family methyltransferase